MDIVSIILGWPSALLGTFLLVAGVASRKIALAILGLLVSAGFLVYVAMNPLPFGGLGLAGLAGNAAAIFSLHRRRQLLAALFLIPHITVLFVLSVAVLQQL